MVGWGLPVAWQTNVASSFSLTVMSELVFSNWISGGTWEYSDTLTYLQQHKCYSIWPKMHLGYWVFRNNFFAYKCVTKLMSQHSVWKSQKMSHSTLRAKRVTFTFWAIFATFWKPAKQCYQTGHKNCWKMSKFKNSNVTFWCTKVKSWVCNLLQIAVVTVLFSSSICIVSCVPSFVYLPNTFMQPNSFFMTAVLIWHI